MTSADGRHPYDTLPDDAFWRLAVAAKSPFELNAIWRPKAPLRRDAMVATAGSCFAQHISRALKRRGFGWLDTEPAPFGMPPDVAESFGYGVFSFRTGNIYSAALLRQWLGWAAGDAAPSDELWRDDDGRWFDPFRPAIQPGGFSDADDVRAARATTLRAIRRGVSSADVFLFTLGLTECWQDAATGEVFPLCPGVAAGRFDPQRHILRNFGFERIRDDLQAATAVLKRLNPAIRVILTVSPVPLIATVSGEHALVANTYTKSTLRAVAGELAAGDPTVDYFPSYEMVATSPMRGMFYNPNMRTITPAGVAFVMEAFFAEQGAAPAEPSPSAPQPPAQPTANDLACEEELLDAPQ
ncbi:GSCFA domain-containing protein [Methylopila henanensis]|uniref:GSCFA domain-containing protein n=1 Tax=Methylopila henanensis TaxID=873516 RepID=A0ABW4KBJ8_9HYPH